MTLCHVLSFWLVLWKFSWFYICVLFSQSPDQNIQRRCPCVSVSDGWSTRFPRQTHQYNHVGGATSRINTQNCDLTWHKLKSWNCVLWYVQYSVRKVTRTGETSTNIQTPTSWHLMYSTTLLHDTWCILQLSDQNHGLSLSLTIPSSPYRDVMSSVNILIPIPPTPLTVYRTVPQVPPPLSSSDVITQIRIKYHIT